MNELQAAVFFGLLSIPFAIALGIKLTRVIFRGVLILFAVPVLCRRAVRRAPGAAYELLDRGLQELFPPRLDGFAVEYATLEYYLRTSSRPLSLEQHLRANGGGPAWHGGASWIGGLS